MTAPARQSQHLRRRGQDEHEAGETIVGKDQPEQQRERGRGDHQQIEALRLGREAACRPLFTIQFRVNDGMIRPPIIEIMMINSAIAPRQPKPAGNQRRPLRA